MAESRVLVVENDPAISRLVEAILMEERVPVAVLHRGSLEALAAWVDTELPGCVLLDGGGTSGFGESWEVAAWLGTRAPPIPVVMFTADQVATQEARAGESARSRAAAFAAILDKPFDLDALVTAVTRIVRPRGTGAALEGLAPPLTGA